mgnify:CR=1 FL=1
MSGESIQRSGLGVIGRVWRPMECLESIAGTDNFYTFVMYEGVKEMREERKNLYSCPGLDEACGLLAVHGWAGIALAAFAPFSCFLQPAAF